MSKHEEILESSISDLADSQIPDYTPDGPSPPQSPAAEEDPWQIVSNGVVRGSVWYEDGNVIVQAESTQFKVFQGVLTTHSPVFIDILDDPEIEEDDGCRIIRTNDSAEDMRYFLEAFHVLTLPDGLSELPQIAAFLRLGTRYRVPVLRRIAIKTLTTSYPSTYHLWCRRQLHRTFTPTDAASFAVLNLAREFNITQILPTVMYQCSRFCKIESILQGYNGRKIQDPLDMQRCIVAKATFSDAVHRAFSFFGEEHPPGEGCAEPENCVLEGYRMMKRICSQETSPLGVKIDWNQYTACRVCAHRAKKIVMVEKQKYWDGLPELYGLPGWQAPTARY